MAKITEKCVILGELGICVDMYLNGYNNAESGISPSAQKTRESLLFAWFDCTPLLLLRVRSFVVGAVSRAQDRQPLAGVINRIKSQYKAGRLALKRAKRTAFANQFPYALRGN